MLTVSAIMAMGSVVALILFLMLPEQDGDSILAEDENGNAGVKLS